MNRTPRPSFWKPLLLLCTLALTACWCFPPEVKAEIPPTTQRADSLMAQTRQKVERDLRAKGFAVGQPVFIRIFKLPGTLELWMDKGHGYDLYKTYRICNYSGFPGPKINEGDWQAPEGFYSVTAEQMNPKSQFHLAFDIGYPNDYDTSRNYTGNLIMVHGNCKSVGCFAMTDNRIEEIYMLAYAALMQGQEQFDVHIFPFPLNAKNLKKFAASPWIRFWKTLEPGFSAFEHYRQVPEVAVKNGQYVITPRTSQLAMKRAFGQRR
jgi:murein L,D-transpeptidase YafK